MSRAPLIVIVLAVGTLAAACGTEPTPMTSQEDEIAERVELQEVLWRLVELQAESGDMTPVLDRTTIDIEFLGTEFGVPPAATGTSVTTASGKPTS